MDLNLFISELKRLGVPIFGGGVTDSLDNLLKQLQAIGTPSKSSLETANTEQVESANAALATATERVKALEVEVANAKAAHRDALLQLAIETGRISVAERKDWERRLNLDAANEAPALIGLPVKYKTVPTADAARQSLLDPAKTASTALLDTANEIYRGLSAEEQAKSDAWAKSYEAAKVKNPGAWAAMQGR
jgi:hypothetical protein